MNRKFEARLFALTLALSALAYGQTAAKAAAATPASKPATAAADPVAGPTKIGVINIQAAIILTNEGQRDVGVLNTKFDPRRAELTV